MKKFALKQEGTEPVDHVQVLQDYLMSSELDMPQLLPILERLEPIIEAMYGLGLTQVVPVCEMPPLHEQFQRHLRHLRHLSGT